MRGIAMAPRRPGRSARRLVALIVGVTVVPLGTLVWLGWRLAEQDRVLEHQQVQQRVERAADLIVAALQRAIGILEYRLTNGTADWPQGAVAVVFRSPEKWRPEAPAALFAKGEALEFRQRDLPAAAAVFRKLSTAADPAVRAGALARLGRVLRTAGRYQEARAAYSHLNGMDAVAVQGVPASLVAAYALGSVLEQLHDNPALRRLGAELDADLRSGRWALTAALYELYAKDAARWRGAETGAETLVAEAVGDVWSRWSSGVMAPDTAGREILKLGGQRPGVLWIATKDELRILVVTGDFIQAEWVAPVTTIARDQHVAVDLDPSGARPAGVLSASEESQPGDRPPRPRCPGASLSGRFSLLSNAPRSPCDAVGSCPGCWSWGSWRSPPVTSSCARWVEKSRSPGCSPTSCQLCPTSSGRR